ncbi:GIY-YIG nuclease family protein [Geodermatophilus sabuli]|uniref:GIY-YIG nuclease family protein n=1 Tax=Geodermatophilus sabuli TaxID=1564158 RepID=A0A7K3VWM1_9ACTN|nr:GIY-YIG nuclease family protein [Geodermatophilus sabuli]NEK57041.1 GIY-YIG nuclease family protein [Geodermatophilus sabuli]
MRTVDLRTDVVPADEARDVVPSEPGLYAWWSRPGALPGITGPLHLRGEHELLYVGLARSGPSSRATLRSRVVGNHIRGTTGQSTLRRSLASLLFEQEGWRSRFTDRPLLVPDDELRLNEWMQQHLVLTWAMHEQPWTVEAQVIADLAPPLNQSANSSHPLYPLVRDARRRWRQAARQAEDEQSHEV